ncbi:MAG: TusE/DsrC/DsvC family sulfur relay protein [Pseudomonadales bacterium]|jgi:tRNA 2-thiouridine synthesizing protein E|nr:TusE/DsrC/DsvC family sulfur relay protein [Pseudomonadales bacterium]MDP6473075.1 TusE/DsrC/DsvC family sulfur relay protein [Pseudomonadales bacterium]MDP6826168.1 TusE/DsrC/DsvC family sulfur relay protein [Pseudomonadales bacterium]MDP6971956.1 TusE/DsrC/DsvC family sulfur relay protein [Pseudomonadales bacterium]|tara:strand:- start:368 stop:688 length:321 start_codon:yes stop_codon:yes gene_type:complete
MNHSLPATDKEGYLVHLDDWSPDVAARLAHMHGVELTPAHWEIIQLMRDFHAHFDLSPAMRPMVKWVKQHLGDRKGNSIYLMGLFPGSPAKLAALIAGLPRPTHCL